MQCTDAIYGVSLKTTALPETLAAVERERELTLNNNIAEYFFTPVELFHIPTYQEFHMIN